MTRTAALLAASLHIVACGGDDGQAPVDPIDAGRSLDSAVALCSDAADCAGESFARVCANGACIECTDSADCSAPNALGPSCDTASGECRCDDDNDCAGNPNGPTCNPVVNACGCVSDPDCPDPQRCELQPYLGSGVRTCQQL